MDTLRKGFDHGRKTKIRGENQAGESLLNTPSPGGIGQDSRIATDQKPIGFGRAIRKGANPSCCKRPGKADVGGILGRLIEACDAQSKRIKRRIGGLTQEIQDLQQDLIEEGKCKAILLSMLAEWEQSAQASVTDQTGSKSTH